MIPVLAVIARFVSVFAFRFFTSWVVVKVFISTLVLIALPLTLQKLIVWLYNSIQSSISSNVTVDTIDSIYLQLSGLGGWLVSTCQLTSCFSIVLSAVALRFILNCLPFTK